MHFDAFDRYHESESFVHRLDPRVKVVVTVVFILSNALLPDGAWIAFGLSWLFLLLANALSKLGMGFTFRRSLIALPFALIAITGWGQDEDREQSHAAGFDLHLVKPVDHDELIRVVGSARPRASA